MSTRTITVTEARLVLENPVPAEQSLEETLIITGDGQPLWTLLPYRVHQDLLANVASLQTMLEIMLGGSGARNVPSRPQQTGEAAPSNQKSISWEEFKAEVGWE